MGGAPGGGRFGGAGGAGGFAAGKQCYGCGGYGHISSECPTAGRQNFGGRGAQVCYNCQQPGHRAAECT